MAERRAGGPGKSLPTDRSLGRQQQSPSGKHSADRVRLDFAQMRMGRIHAAEIERRLVEIQQAAREAISFAAWLSASAMHRTGLRRTSTGTRMIDAQSKSLTFSARIAGGYPFHHQKLAEALTSSASQWQGSYWEGRSVVLGT
jgi:hypothetical protein